MGIAERVAQPGQGDLLHVAAHGALVGGQQRLVRHLFAQAVQQPGLGRHEEC